MTQICEAVYENGVFRLITPLASSLVEGQQVRIVVEADTTEDILSLAAHVYEGLSDQEANEVEEIALDRTAFFSQPTP